MSARRRRERDLADLEILAKVASLPPLTRRERFVRLVRELIGRPAPPRTRLTRRGRRRLEVHARRRKSDGKASSSR